MINPVSQVTMLTVDVRLTSVGFAAIGAIAVNR